MCNEVNEASWKLHNIALRVARNDKSGIRDPLRGILKDLIEIRRSNKSDEVANLIRQTFKAIDFVEDKKQWLTKQETLMLLTGKIKNQIWISWIESLPLPIPSLDYQDVPLPFDLIQQRKLPDCSLIAILNALFFGKNNVKDRCRMIVKETDTDIYCVFYANGSRKIATASKVLNEQIMCNSYYGRIVERVYFTFFGFYTYDGDVGAESQTIISKFKGADFTDVGMVLLGFIPLPRPMTLDVKEWESIYQTWLKGEYVIGFGTSNFNDLKRIKLTNGNLYPIIPNHDYPVINILNDTSGFIFEVFDGVKLIQFKISDLIHFDILSINVSPAAMHQIETFVVTENSWIEFNLKSEHDEPYMIVLERHLPRSWDLGTHSECLSLFKTASEHTGLLWLRDNLLEEKWNLSRFTVIQCREQWTQLCMDLKVSGGNTMFTLHCYSSLSTSIQRVQFDDYVILKGRFKGKDRLGFTNFNENPSWEFQLRSTKLEYVEFHMGVFSSEENDINLNIYDTTNGKLLLDSNYQRGKQLKLVFLQTNQSYKLIISSFKPSFSKFKVISDKFLSFIKQSHDPPI